MLERIMVMAAETYGYSEEELKGPSREASLVRARHVAMWAAVVAGATVSETGRVFKRDHSTVCHAVDKVWDKPDLLRVGRELVRRLQS